MNTLFLIGNGFDVNCGMKTKYTDIYERYIKELSISPVINKFKKNISADYKTWCDFEMAMAEYAKNLNSETEFLECVRDFAEYMEKHLFAENDRVKKILEDKVVLNAVVKEMVESLKNFYTSISHNIDTIMERRNATNFMGFRAISFNYTDVFDVLWEETFRDYQNDAPVIHIHGILQDGPVLGVDNISQVNTNYELTRKGKRGFIKPIFNSEYDEERVIEAKQRIKSAWTICVFGMSFGDSDLSWRNEIIEWLKENKQHHLFVYKYNFSNVKYYTVAEKLDIEDDAKMQLLSEWGIKDEKLFDQIHIPCGKNIFNVENVLKEEVLKRNKKIADETKKKIEE